MTSIMRSVNSIQDLLGIALSELNNDASWPRCISPRTIVFDEGKYSNGVPEMILHEVLRGYFFNGGIIE